jgi:hypothetical protein
MGTFSSRTIYEMMPSAPCSNPAAPKPRNARPKIRIVEEDAVAQIIDPTITTQNTKQISKWHIIIIIPSRIYDI